MNRFEPYITVAKYAFAAAVGGGIGLAVVKGVSEFARIGRSFMPSMNSSTETTNQDNQST